MPKNNRKLNILFELYHLQRPKIGIVVLIFISISIIMSALTITNVQYVFNGFSGYDKQSYFQQLIEQINTTTYKNIINNEIKSVPVNVNADKHLNTNYGTSFELSAIISKLLTGIEIYNLQTIFYQEVPAFSLMSTELIGGSKQLDVFMPPEETPPPDYLFSNNQNDMQIDDDTNNVKQIEKNDPNISRNNIMQKPPVLIYHTHNREAYLPELDANVRDDEAYHQERNITLVGKYLAEELEQLGVPTILSSKDYWNELPHGEYWRSYELSKIEIDKIVDQNEYIPFIFDIHRDSSVRSRTTVKYQEEEYAALWFIIGQLNPNWQYNYQFAASIESKIENNFTGISRGIWAKKTGHYNQQVSANSVLIEIGGIDNTLDEAKKTTKILAKTISELYWDEIKNAK
jgi:stage II sporulation protein P